MNVKGTDAMERLHRRPSVPTVIATVALVFAMAGVAPAASKLINGKNIKKGTVTGTQIKDHSVKKVDLAADALVGAARAGPKGAAGARGNDGAPGSDGQDGAPGTPGDSRDARPGRRSRRGRPGSGLLQPGVERRRVGCHDRRIARREHPDDCSVRTS